MSRYITTWSFLLFMCCSNFVYLDFEYDVDVKADTLDMVLGRENIESPSARVALSLSLVSLLESATACPRCNVPHRT